MYIFYKTDHFFFTYMWNRTG